MMLVTCTLAVLGLMYSSAPIWALVRPAASSRSTASSRLVSPWDARASAGSGTVAAAGACSGMRARSASARTCASSGAWPSAAAAADCSAAAAAAAADCPVFSCAWACRHHAYPARCGQPRSCQVLAAAPQAAGSLAPASRVCSASQVARSAGIAATNG